MLGGRLHARASKVAAAGRAALSSASGGTAPKAKAGGGVDPLALASFALGAAGVAYLYMSDEARSSSLYHSAFRRALMPALRLMDPETAHGVGIRGSPLSPTDAEADDPVLRVEIPQWGHAQFSNPIGLAAGFDKQGEAMEAMLKAGFGFVEVGTVTPQPQPGNPKPRMFRLVEDRAVINRYGFNSDGIAPVLERVKAFRGDRAAAAASTAASGEGAGGEADAEAASCVSALAPRHGGPSAQTGGGATIAHRTASGLVGINVGKNKTTEDAAADYTAGIEAFAASADYIVVNVSSPNTPGLRDLQHSSQLRALLGAAVAARGRAAAAHDPSGRWKGPPLLVKIAPDVDDAQLTDMVEAAIGAGVDGLVVSNTTVERPASLQSEHKAEAGGLSGEPVREKSTRVLRRAFQLCRGRVPIVGVGGVASGQHAYDKIRSGASLVQLYTALAYEGPALVRDVKQELAALLKRDGFASVQAAVGVDAAPTEADSGRL